MFIWATLNESELAEISVSGCISIEIGGFRTSYIEVNTDLALRLAKRVLTERGMTDVGLFVGSEGLPQYRIALVGGRVVVQRRVAGSPTQEP